MEKRRKGRRREKSSSLMFMWLFKENQKGKFVRFMCCMKQQKKKKNRRVTVRQKIRDVLNQYILLMFAKRELLNDYQNTIEIQVKSMKLQHAKQNDVVLLLRLYSGCRPTGRNTSKALAVAVDKPAGRLCSTINFVRLTEYVKFL